MEDILQSTKTRTEEAVEAIIGRGKEEVRKRMPREEISTLGIEASLNKYTGSEFESVRDESEEVCKGTADIIRILDDVLRKIN